MKKIAVFVAVAAAISSAAVPAHAGGWGRTSTTQASQGGLINLSPSIQLGDLGIANGLNILGGASLLSNNVLSGLVKGANNNVGQSNVTGHQNAVGNGVIRGSIGNTVNMLGASRLGRR